MSFFFKFFDLRIKQQINLWFFIEIPRNLSNRLQLRSMILTNKSYKNLFFKKKMRRKFNDKKKNEQGRRSIGMATKSDIIYLSLF